MADEGSWKSHQCISKGFQLPFGGEVAGHQQLERRVAGGDGQPRDGDRPPVGDQVPAPVQHRADPTTSQGDHRLPHCQGGAEVGGQGQGPGRGDEDKHK